MNTTTAIVVILLLILSLSNIRRRIILELESISLILFNNTNPGLYLYAILVLPGTIIHELSHWIFAELLRVPTGEISILPSSSKGSNDKQLGYVMTAKTGPIRGLVIGISPIIVSITALSFLAKYVKDTNFTLITEFSWEGLLLFYLFIILGNTIATSKSDRHFLPHVAIIVGLVTLTLSKTQLSLATSLQLEILALSIVISKGLAMALAVSLIAYLIFFITRKLLEKITKNIISFR